MPCPFEYVVYKIDRLCVITGTIAYAATSLLKAIRDNSEIRIEASLDLESLAKCIIALMIPQLREVLEAPSSQVRSQCQLAENVWTHERIFVIAMLLHAPCQLHASFVKLQDLQVHLLITAHSIFSPALEAAI